MKKFYLFLLTLCLASVYSLPAAAYEDDLDLFEVNGLHYALKAENKVYVINSFHYFYHQQSELIDETNYSGLSGDVVIPNRVKVSCSAHAIYGYQDIVAIEDNAFKKMQSPVRIQLLSKMKHIGSRAFIDATGLQGITMNEGLESIGFSAFDGCTNLSNVNIPSTLKYIPDCAFRDCSSLQYITLPTAIDSLGYGAFDRCTSLQYVWGSSTDFIWVQKIGKCAFWGCTDLRYISFSARLETIGESAFNNCKKLSDIKLPVNLKTIGEQAFANTGLRTVTNYSTTPQAIDASVFWGVNLSRCILFVPKGCTEKYQNAEVWKKFGQILEVGDRPEMTGVYRIGDLYYDLHEDMTATLVKHEINENHSGSLTIPASVSFEQYGFNYTYTVNKMEDEAFLFCTNLTSVELPITLEAIPDKAFSGCTGLTKVTLPPSLSKIGSAAFYNCSALKDLALPGSLVEIGSGAFSRCQSLTSVSIPSGVEVLPENCFLQCSQLSKVELHEGLKEIQSYAFNRCDALTTITLPESLTKIGTYVLASANLTSIRCFGETPATATDESFGPALFSSCILYVPVGSKEAYQTAPGWKNFADIREKGENKRIKYGDLYYYLKEDFTAIVSSEESEGRNNYPYLEGEVTVADKVLYEGREYKVNSVGEDAFMNASKVTKVNLPNTIEKIWTSAFWGTGLTEINLPPTLTLLASSAFENTPLFNSNKDADGAVYYDNCLLSFPNTYSGAYSVKEGTRLIASYVFAAIPGLTEIRLPEGLQCICTGAIDKLPLLKVLSMPSSITYIGSEFLSSTCSKLNEIYCYSERPYKFTSDDYFKNWTQEQLAQIKLYVPAGTRAAYAQADKWKDLSIAEMDPFYTVTFVDYDGTELDVQRVQKGKDATAPEAPTREGYNFTGWDRPFTNVKTDLTITAQYEIKTYVVLFVDGYTDGEIDTQYVVYGGSATEPEAPKHEGYVFIGWDKEFDFITGNTIVTAQYLEGDGVVTTVYHIAQQRLTYYYDKELVRTRVGITEVYNPASSAPRFEGYSDKVRVIEIHPSMKNANLTSMNCLFYGADILSLRNVTSIIGLENLNTSSVTDMNGMFFLCQSLETLDLSSFDTKNVTDMNGMFMGCVNLEVVDVSSFDISNVTDMRMMFAGCSKLKTICCSDDWSTSTAQSGYMFSTCNSLVGGQGTVFNGNVTDKTYARPDGGTEAPGYFTEKIEKVYTEFVEETGTLTYYYDDKINLRTGVTELYTPGSTRFTGYYKKVLKCVIDPSMKNAPITSMRTMFEGGFNSETLDNQSLKNMTSIEGLENLNTSIVTDMNSMFSGCESLTALDLSSFDTRNVTNMNGMFLACTGLKIIDLNSFDVSNVTDMRMMFSSCWELTTICCSNDWSNCQADTYIMFYLCRKLVGDKGTVYDGNVTDKTYARPDGGVGAPGYFTADTMTGINSLSPAFSESEEAVYNLGGQRLNKPAKGINIIGGRKVLVK